LTPPDVTIHPLAPGELDQFETLDAGGGPALGPPGRDFLATAADRHYRPEWTWVARRGGRVVARAAWWGGPDDDRPYAVDWFDLGAEDDRVAIGAALLRAAHEDGAVRADHDGTLAQFHMFLPPDWRDRDDVRTAAEDRVAAAEQAGLSFFVERLRIEWTSDASVPERSDRLRFGPVPDDPALLELLERINVGTLDAHARRDIEQDGPAAAARTQLEGMAWMPAPRDWWLVGTTPDGETVGLVMPSRNYEAAAIGYIGVVAEHRGHGYVDDLLAEGTALLAAEGADLIRADTDTGNAPMAAAFARAGYRVVARRIVMT
jgi:RimJ/RimL family protein N-acetyltransferase